MEFFTLACLAALLASIASGTVGSLVVVKRITFLAGSISHSILGGMGFCLWLQKVHHVAWASPTLGAFVAALLSAFWIGKIHMHHRQREDSLIAAIWSTGMAIGVICLAFTPGNQGEMVGLLFGNILWITPTDLYLLFALDVLILLVVGWYYAPIVALLFDVEQAKLQKIPTQKLYFLLLSLVAIATVLLVELIGTILVLALLTLPATIASFWAKTLFSMIRLAILWSMTLSTGGILLAYLWDWPPGATIALLASCTYALLLPLRRTYPNTIFRRGKPPAAS